MEIWQGVALLVLVLVIVGIIIGVAVYLTRNINGDQPPPPNTNYCVSNAVPLRSAVTANTTTCSGSGWSQSIVFSAWNSEIDGALPICFSRQLTGTGSYHRASIGVPVCGDAGWTQQFTAYFPPKADFLANATPRLLYFYRYIRSTNGVPLGTLYISTTELQGRADLVLDNTVFAYPSI